MGDGTVDAPGGGGESISSSLSRGSDAVTQESEVLAEGTGVWRERR